MTSLALRVLHGERYSDVEARFGELATVGDLADRIRRCLPAGPAGDELGLLLGADTPEARFVGAAMPITDSAVCSGLTIRVCAPQPAVDPPIAILSLLAGPDAPTSIELRQRTVSIGRAGDSDVRLTDPLVSRRHARLRLGEPVEIVDDGSVNGIALGRRVVDRARVGPGDRVVLGDTVLSVVRLSATADHGIVRNQVAFNRPPRVDPAYVGIELKAPEPPHPPTEQRFPLLSLLVPILMALTIYAVTQSVLAILFVALSPLMIVGSWLDTRAANRRQLAQAVASFRSGLHDLEVQLDYASRLERAGRAREHPAAIDVLEACEARSSLLWARRPEHARFGEIRLGVGTRRSRNSVVMPNGERALPDLARELQAVVARFAELPGVPIAAELRACGNVGVAGPDAVASAAIRALLVQLVGLHAPAELIVACVAVREAHRWDWLAWLPHARRERGPLAGCNLAGDSVEAASLAAALDGLIEQRSTEALPGVPIDERSALPLVAVVVDDRAPIDRSRYVQIAERGPAVGVHVVWLAVSVDQLPAACRAFLDLGNHRAVAGLVVDGERVPSAAPEQIGAAAAERFARLLSPVVDSGAPPDAQADLPVSVGLLELFGGDVADDPDAVVEHWRESRSLPGSSGTGSLRALVGQAADGPLHLDLRTDGPHALVGGTTGSGKSELLQTWVASLAVTHSPARVTFLFVDYKGGAAFADCVDLPHCVGLVTDLDGRLVRRALRSLDAELRRRERLLRAAGAKDLLDLERGGDPRCPPRLVIVVDEFAALVAEVPEFVDGVVNVAQRGRSLGLHLVLATQRPAGVVSDHVRANTDLRIALRVADTADSVDVVGSPVAATFDRAVPGRAVVTTGPGWLTGFQCAHAGVPSARSRSADVIVRPLRFGAERGWESEAGAAAGGRSDLARIVQSVVVAAEQACVAAPRRPWLPELASVYPLGPSGPDELVVGVSDDPDAQSQPPALFRPDSDGNMAVFGTGGSGKTTLLRSLAAGAAAATADGAPCWVYCLDFAARGLQPLVVLPNVGGVVPGDDHERVVRVLRWLASMLDERAHRYGVAGAATLGDYRRRTGHDDEPRVVLLVDGIGSFRAEYEGTGEHRWWDTFLALAAGGRGVGIHVVVTADRAAALPSALAAAVQRRLVLRLANDVEAAMLGAPADSVLSSAPSGRGWLDGREVQVAVPGGVADLAGQRTELERLAERVAKRGPAAPAIGRLPERVALAELPPTVGGRPVIGLSDETLEPTGFTASGTFVVAGPPRSGRTTTVVTVVRSMIGLDGVVPILLGRRGSPLAGVVDWAAAAFGIDGIDRLARCLVEQTAADGRRRLVVVEAIGDLLGSEADCSVHGLITACRDSGSLVVAEGETSELTGSWPLLQAVRAGRTGIVLQPDQLDGEVLFKTPFPRISRAGHPPGRGLLVRDGRVEQVQVALP